MKEEDLKKEIKNILDIYGKEIEEVNRLRDIEPHENPVYLYLEAQARLEGFQAGQLAERQRCLKMIEEFIKKYCECSSEYWQCKSCFILVELTQKINEGDK